MLRMNVLRFGRILVEPSRCSRRFISTPVQKEAFLEPVKTHPGIVSLALNRPQAKNAISVALLQVCLRLYGPNCANTQSLQQQLRECLEEAHFDKRYLQKL